MSDNKKYYWLKLMDNFFNTDDIKLLRKKDNGEIYIIIWQKLLLKAITQKEIGLLYYKDTIPYDAEMLSDVLDENIDHVKGAFDQFIKLQMIEILEDGSIWIQEACKLVGSETSKAELMRRLRHNREQKGNNVTKQLPNVTKCRPELELEKELEIEIDKKKINITQSQIEQVINKYPSKCPIRFASTNRSVYSKEKLKAIIREYDVDTCCKIIDRYVKDCKKTKTYLKNFKTFVNNFPSLDDFTLEEKEDYLVKQTRERNAEYDQWKTAEDINNPENIRKKNEILNNFINKISKG